MALRVMGRKNVSALIASDGVLDRGWHVALDVLLKPSEISSLVTSLKHFAQRFNLSTVRFTPVQLQFGIFNHEVYMTNHNFVRDNVKLC